MVIKTPPEQEELQLYWYDRLLYRSPPPDRESKIGTHPFAHGLIRPLLVIDARQRKPQVFPPPAEAWEVQGDAVQALRAIPVAWDAISPSPQAYHRTLEFVLDPLQMSEGDRVQPSLVLKNVQIAQPAHRVYKLMGEEEIKFLHDRRLCLDVKDSDFSFVKIRPLTVLVELVDKPPLCVCG